MAGSRSGGLSINTAALPSMREEIALLDPHVLTPTHTQYLQACLVTHQLTEALRIASLPFYTTAPKITTRQYLEHHLAAALAYISIEDFKSAQAELEIILTTPTQNNALSAIQIDAYRKWLLLYLLTAGPHITQDPPVPRAVTPSNLKSLRAIAKPYECIVEAFRNHDPSRLRGDIEAGAEIWQQDGNYGLVAEVFAAHRRYAVLRLSSVFSSLPLEEVARRTSLNPQDVQETSQYITGLISAGQLNGTLVSSPDGGTGILRFNTAKTTQKSEQEISALLAAKSLQLSNLLEQVAEHDHTFELSPEYVEFLQKAKKAQDQEKKQQQQGEGKGGAVGGASTNWGAPGPMPGGLDEDMMDDW